MENLFHVQNVDGVTKRYMKAMGTFMKIKIGTGTVFWTSRQALQGVHAVARGVSLSPAFAKALPKYITGYTMIRDAVKRDFVGSKLTREDVNYFFENVAEVKEQWNHMMLTGLDEYQNSGGISRMLETMGKPFTQMDTFVRGSAYVGGITQFNESFAAYMKTGKREHLERGIRSSNLALLPENLQIQILRDIDAGKYEGAARKFGKSVSDNSQWLYKLSERSAAFQKMSGLLAVTFPISTYIRDLSSTLWQDGVMKAIDGTKQLAKGNFDLTSKQNAFQGLKYIITFALASYAADWYWMNQFSSSKSDYGWNMLMYRIGGPVYGLTKAAFDAWNSIWEVQANLKNDKAILSAAQYLTKTAGNGWLPFYTQANQIAGYMAGKGDLDKRLVDPTYDLAREISNEFVKQMNIALGKKMDKTPQEAAQVVERSMLSMFNNILWRGDNVLLPRQVAEIGVAWEKEKDFDKKMKLKEKLEDALKRLPISQRKANGVRNAANWRWFVPSANKQE